MTSGTDHYRALASELMASQQALIDARRQMKFDTIAVHGLYDFQQALANQGSIIEPIYASASQAFENSDHMEVALAYEMPAWIYTRTANPTNGYLEGLLALLEGYGYDGPVTCCATGSGMSAVAMATDPFIVRDESLGPPNIVASAKCYGGTFQLFSVRYEQERGIEVRWVRDELNLDEWASKIDENTRFVYGEMPSNPSLAVFDIHGLAEIAHANGIPLIVDSTVATPALMRPLAHGADIVVHSVTKAMTGGGMGVAGAVIARGDIPSRVGSDEMKANFALYVKGLTYRDYGPALSPFNALQAINEIRTLRSRVAHMSRNALKVAQFLNRHPAVAQVNYPGLSTFVGYKLARQYMWLVDGDMEAGAPVNSFGHLLSFEPVGGAAAARRVMDRLQLIFRATDLGRVKTVATIPAISTHQQQGETGRDLADVSPALIRLSVGGEHPDDIIADLDQALSE